MIEDPDRPSKALPPPPQARRVSVVAHMLLLVGAAVAVFLAGGPQQANLGAFLVFAGVALIFCPPQQAVHPGLGMIGGGLVAAVCLAFLPQAWLPTPQWRRMLVESGIPLGPHVTPVPGETAFWASLLAITVAVAFLALSHPLRSRAQLGAAVFVLAATALYVGLAMIVRKSGWDLPIDANPADFGFFSNRNHTSSFLTVGCLVALAVLGVLARGHWAAGALAAIVLASSASGLLFFSTSRGGVLALFAGTLLWIAGLGREHRSRPLVISFLTITAAAGVLFLASPGEVRERMLRSVGLLQDRARSAPVPGAGVEEPPLDARLVIFRDTMRIVGDFPMTGVGLGAFRPVFSFYNKGMPPETPVGHPESDWLMLAAEAGLPALLLLAIGIGWLLRRAWRQRDHPYWPLRWGLICAALAGLGHGFVDVPAHRAALGWWTLAIGIVGAQTFRSEAARPQRWMHGIFIVTGLAAAALGLQLIRADYFGAPPSPPIAAGLAEAEIIILRENGQIAESIARARAAVTKSPLAPRLNLQLAVSLLAASASPPEVEAAMLRERLVAPQTAAVLVEEGFVWADTDIERARAVWQEALARQEQIDNRFGRHAQLSTVFGNLMQNSAPYPDLQRSLLTAAGDRIPLVLIWLRFAPPEVASAELPALLARPAVTTGLNEQQRAPLLELWYTRGERAALWSFAAAHPDWQKSIAPFEWRQLAENGQPEEAVQRAAVASGVSLEMPAIGPSAAAAGAAGDDALSVFRAAWAKGNTVTARRVLEEARNTRPVDPEVWRLLAAWSARDGQWPAAWRHLSDYLQALRETPRK